ncbi:MAG: hypothetical protein ACFE9T_07180 [Promethearchaeota archaeon]
MNFAIPRNNNSELLLYIWKIIDLPYISQNDLLFKISFEFFLFSPEEGIKFIKRCIEDKSLIIDAKNNLKLSNTLRQNLINWQKESKFEILNKIISRKKITITERDIETNTTTNFNVFIKAFLDKGTLNRAASVSNTKFDIIEFDPTKGKINAKVSGSKEESYLIKIDINNKILQHNCHDFETRRAENKKFCKHLTKLFLLLKEKNSNSAETFLKEIAANIDKWEFTV